MSKKSQAKSQRRRRQQQQQQGGTAYTLEGAPLSYSLFDTMAGKQSMEQGLNYLQ